MFRALVLATALLSGAAAAAPVKGRIVDPSGTPLAGVEVLVFERDARRQVSCASKENGLQACLCPESIEKFVASLAAGLPGPRAPLAKALTGSDGRFSLEVGAPNGAMLLATSADGALSALTELTEPQEELDLALESVVTREVEVLAPPGVRPILFMEDAITGALLPPISFSGDRAVFGPVRSWGIPSVHAVARGHLSSSSWLHDFPGQPEPSVRLAPPAKIEGRVTLDGKPVAGATVRLAQPTCRTSVKTDARGRFSLPRIYGPPSLTQVACSHGGRVAQAWASFGAEAELALQRASSLELTFVDPQGKPVAGTLVTGAWRPARSASAVPTHLRATTDAQGRVSFGDLEPGVAEGLTLRDHVQLEPEKARLDQPQPSKVTLRVVRGVELRGVASRPDGQPLAHAQVSAFLGEDLQAQQSEQVRRNLHPATVTDWAGRFRLENLLPGSYEITVRDQALGEATTKAQAPGEAKVALAPETIGLDVSVRHADGRPAAEVDVDALQKSQRRVGKTDAQGRVHLSLPAGGAWALSTRAKRLAPATAKLEAKPGANAATLTLPAPVVVEGVVLGPDGKPVAGARLLAVAMASPFASMALSRAMRAAVAARKPPPARGELPVTFADVEEAALAAARMSGLGDWVARATSGPGGRFSMDVLGEVLLGASSGELSAGVVAKPGQVELTLTRHATAKGRVVDPKGKPLGAFTVDGREQATADGAFRVVLSDAAQTLTFAARGYTPATRKVEPGTEPKEIDLGDVALGVASKLTGVVIDGVGKAPVKDVWLKAKVGEVEKSASTDASGSFEIKDLPQGEVRLTVSPRGDVFAETGLLVKAGTEKVEIKVFRKASLRVTVVDPKTQRPREDVDVKAQGPDRPDKDPDRRSHDTDQNGRTKLRGLAPGKWTLTIGDAKPRVVELEPGEEKELEIVQ